ncbi:hypothetical protein [Pilibacter termitis]|uniref:hypothetical protein n=1 Tax=Pilibacter termitis TaxID=263852 RepID=UPI001184D2A4|nr:hypothetical protein [Pilibacter termitis]
MRHCEQLPNFSPVQLDNRKAKRGVHGFVAESHAIYLPEAELQVALRTATKTMPLVARQTK